MKIGYPCINRTIGVSASRSFRLASYSPERLRSTVQENLAGLQGILEWNRDRGVRFFRISSETIPFASHPVMDVDWQREFRSEFAAIGEYIRSQDMRVNMHPGQYTLLSSPRPDVQARSVAELVYHAELLDLLELDRTHVIQIHVGGVYGDRAATISTVIARIAGLPDDVRNRLVIENDEHHYPLADCLSISGETGLPVLLDVFHHSILNSGESIPAAVDAAGKTWSEHGLPMIDFSSQNGSLRVGAHALALNEEDFRTFLKVLGNRDVDIMLEIKDKEASALQALSILRARDGG